MAAMFTPGALGTVTPDPTDTTENTPPEYGGLSALQNELAVLRNQEIESRKKSWDMVAQRLEKSRPSKAEMWFSLASALGQPTKTGSFGETLGNTAEALGKSAAERRDYESKVADTMLQRDQDLAELGSKYDLKGMDLKQKAIEAGKVKTTVVDGGYWTQRLGEEPVFHAVSGAPTKTETWTPATQDGVRGQISNRGRFEKADLSVAEEADRASQIDLAKNAAIAKGDLPKATLFAQNAKGIVDKLRNHPGRSAVIGMINPFQGALGVAEIPGTPAADFKALLEQATGNTFLQAYDILRGTGSIATVEGSKGEGAIARMKAAQSEKAFNDALDDYVDFLEAGLAAKQELAAMGPKSSSGTRQAAPTAPPRGSTKSTPPPKNRPPITNFDKKGE